MLFWSETPQSINVTETDWDNWLKMINGSNAPIRNWSQIGIVFPGQHQSACRIQHKDRDSKGENKLFLDVDRYQNPWMKRSCFDNGNLFPVSSDVWFWFANKLGNFALFRQSYSCWWSFIIFAKWMLCFNFITETHSLHQLKSDL